MMRGIYARAAMRSLVAVLTFAGTAFAQQPTVFVHGFQNDGSSWQSTANYLSQHFAIQPLLPTLGWTDRFDTQASRLHNGVAGYSGIPGLAHSNGGIVSRRYVHLWGGSAALNRLATIGTPHRGVWLATNALNGNVGLWAQHVVWAIGDPFFFYSSYDWDWGWVGTPWLYNAAWNMQRLARYIPTGVLYGLGVGAAFPVAFDLPPGGDFMSGLNSSGALSAESSRLAARVGIVTRTRAENAMTRMIFANWRDWERVRWSLWTFALAMQAYYENHPDPWLAANAFRWEVLAIRMMDLDVVWHWQIGTLHPNPDCTAYFCFATVDASDGLVPIYSQEFPAATRSIHIVSSDIIHIAQKNHTVARNAFVDVFRNNFFISGTSGGGGGGGGGEEPPPCEPTPPALVC